MAHSPSDLACQASRPSITRSPVRWTAKSTIVVVPPQAAARVPVSNVSEALVPPNGSSMWVWTSTPPGSTYLPAASTTRSAVVCRSPRAVEPVGRRAAIVSPSTSTSIGVAPSADRTSPFLMRVVTGVAPPRSGLRQGAVGVRPAVPIELPLVADLGDHRQVDVADDQLVLPVAGRPAHDLAPRVGEVARPVEVVVAQRLDADPVDGADEVLVGDGRGGLFEVPQVHRQPAAGGRRVEDHLRPGEAERPPALREVPVVADVDADLADRGVEHGVPEVAGPEVELLPEALDLGDVGLAVLAQVAAVGVDHGGRVVEHALLLALVHGQDHHHLGLGRDRLEAFERG